MFFFCLYMCARSILCVYNTSKMALICNNLLKTTRFNKQSSILLIYTAQKLWYFYLNIGKYPDEIANKIWGKLYDSTNSCSSSPQKKTNSCSLKRHGLPLN